MTLHNLRRQLAKLSATAPSLPAVEKSDAELEAEALHCHRLGLPIPDSALPPCPAGRDPAEWRGRMVASTAWLMRVRGELRPDEYFIGMTEGERADVDQRCAEVEWLRTYMGRGQ